MSDLWDWWSSRIFSSISLFWLGANLHWLMWSRGRGWSGSWSPNSACRAQGSKAPDRAKHQPSCDWQVEVYLQRVRAQQSMSDKWARQSTGGHVVTQLQTQQVPAEDKDVEQRQYTFKKSPISHIISNSTRPASTTVNLLLSPSLLYFFTSTLASCLTLTKGSFCYITCPSTVSIEASGCL